MYITRTLHGTITTLRNIEQSDAERCVGWLADPAITRYMIKQAQTLESERAWIARMRESAVDIVFAICVPDANGEMRHIGNIGLHQFNHTDGHAKADILIGERSQHGNGFGQDAVRTLLAFAFAPQERSGLGLFKVWACVDSPNTASRRMCEHLGLVEEGYLRGQRVLPEGRVDEVLLAAFADSWPPKPRIG